MTQETAQRMQRDLAFLADAQSAGFSREMIRCICRVFRRRYRGPVTWDRTLHVYSGQSAAAAAYDSGLRPVERR